MTRKHWLLIVGWLALCFICLHYAEPQTLQRRTEPTLQPESCRQIMKRNRKVFQAAARVEVSPETKAQLQQLADDLGGDIVVEHICQSKELTSLVNLKASLATYRDVSAGRQEDPRR
jgi:hypothetical protein